MKICIGQDELEHHPWDVSDGKPCPVCAAMQEKISARVRVNVDLAAKERLEAEKATNPAPKDNSPEADDLAGTPGAE